MLLNTLVFRLLENWVVLAANKGRVGVDVMRQVDSRVDRLDEFFRLMKKQFTDAEWEAIRGEDRDSEAEQLARFFRHWALKESYVKAVGTGLNVDLRTLNFILGSGQLEKGKVETRTKLIVEGEEVQWRFEECLVDEHVVSVAVEADDEIQEMETFKVLSIHDVFKLFNHRTDNTTTSENCNTLASDRACPLLRPLDQADFALFSTKAHPKPF